MVQILRVLCPVLYDWKANQSGAAATVISTFTTSRRAVTQFDEAPRDKTEADAALKLKRVPVHLLELRVGARSMDMCVVCEDKGRSQDKQNEDKGTEKRTKAEKSEL